MNNQSVQTVHAIQIIQIINLYYKSKVNSNNPHNSYQVKNSINK
jgi:hypothetical protein